MARRLTLGTLVLTLAPGALFANNCVSKENLYDTAFGDRVVETFDDTGPHRIVLQARGAGSWGGKCRVDLFIQDVENNNEVIVWQTRRTHGDLRAGSRTSQVLDGVRYDFTIVSCNNRFNGNDITLQVQRDVSNYASNVCEGGRPIEVDFSGFVFEPSGELEKVVVRTDTYSGEGGDTRVSEGRGRVNSVSFESSRSREVAISKGLTLTPLQFQRSVERAWQNQLGLSIETSASQSVAKTLPGGTCQSWSVDVIEYRQRYLVSAPGIGTEAVPMIIVRSIDLVERGIPSGCFRP